MESLLSGLQDTRFGAETVHEVTELTEESVPVSQVASLLLAP